MSARRRYEPWFRSSGARRWLDLLQSQMQLGQFMLGAGLMETAVSLPMGAFVDEPMRAADPALPDSVWLNPAAFVYTQKAPVSGQSLADGPLPDGWITEEVWCMACPQPWVFAHAPGKDDPGACPDCGAARVRRTGGAS